MFDIRGLAQLQAHVINSKNPSMPLSVVKVLIQVFVDAQWIVVSADKTYTVTDDVRRWATQLSKDHAYFRQMLKFHKKGIDADFCIFCMIEAQSRRWGDPTVVMADLMKSRVATD